MTELFTLFIGAAIINNIILTRFLGMCPFLGVSKKVDSALGMGAAVTFVIVVSSIVTYFLYHQVLAPLNLQYMDLITFILVIASFVQLVEMIIKKFSPALYKALGIFLPLITTNCAVLGVALDNITAGYSLIEAAVAGVAVSLGFTLVIYVYATIRERLEIADVPDGFKGVPIALITAGLMACAFAGLGGLV